MNPRKLLPLENIDGIYCDAWADSGDDRLVFASLWGRDTAIQGLMARITLPDQENGLSRLELGGAQTKTLRIGNPARLDKLTGRMPKQNLFGDIVQVYLFDKTVVETDVANRRAILLVPQDQPDPQATLWNLFKSVCHLPLLDNWRAILMAMAPLEGWIQVHPGYGLAAHVLELPEQELDLHLEQLIKAGELRLA